MGERIKTITFTELFHCTVICHCTNVKNGCAAEIVRIEQEQLRKLSFAQICCYLQI